MGVEFVVEDRASREVVLLEGSGVCFGSWCLRKMGFWKGIEFVMDDGASRR